MGIAVRWGPRVSPLQLLLLASLLKGKRKSGGELVVLLLLLRRGGPFMPPEGAEPLPVVPVPPNPLAP